MACGIMVPRACVDVVLLGALGGGLFFVDLFVVLVEVFSQGVFVFVLGILLCSALWFIGVGLDQLFG
ncbi:hypothetical protein [Escherichia coli]|uniref:hypothetical protein n=1 Tax=Escherichia coli TaxID=562 RepID=UPI000651BDBA|nr:hypothetical protein [Escherichia coli]KLX63930.1 hypothetical protein SK79_01213 [Escherichia coli]